MEESDLLALKFFLKKIEYASKSLNDMQQYYIALN